MNRKCTWPAGCSVTLSQYNKSDFCGVHQQMMREELIRESIDTEAVIPEWMEDICGEPIEDRILRIVCSSYGITLEQLLSHKRHPHFAFPRQVAAYLLRVDLERSFPKIALILKRKDHTTIIHAYNKIFLMVEAESGVRKDIEKMRSLYKSPA